MAYNVSNNYRTVVYSGEALYDCRLKINNLQVPNSQIQTIKISSPIIDSTTDTGSMFHIGSFISQTLEIKFKNLNGLTLTNNPNIELEIGMYVDDSYEYVPIGKYLIDELDENYQKTCKITCMDYAIKFKSELDIHQFFNGADYILASDLFVAICNYYGVQVGTFPNVNNNKKIYFYDNSISGKQYIMYLAELFGGNAKIGRDGSCNIIPLKNYTNIQIDALTSKSFEIGNAYELTRVCYDNGKQKYQAGGNVITVSELPTTDISTSSFYYLTTNMKYYIYSNDEWEETTTIKNTLYIRNDNIFISQQSDITNIYNAVQGFSITNLTCENRMDLSLDCWDIVTYTVGNDSYQTFYNNTITYNGVAMGKVNVSLPLKTQEETTNVIAATEASQIRTMRTTLNEQEQSIATVITNVSEQDAKISSLTQSVDELTSQISEISDITTSGESNVAFTLTNVNESEPIMLKIHPTTTNISYLYPRDNLYPSDTLYMPDRKIRFHNDTTNEDIDYILPDDLLYYDSTHYDEFYLDYESRTCQVFKRCVYNADGTVALLATERIDDYSLNYPEIHLTTGDYTISMPGYSNCYVFARLMATNIYTTQFYTKVETNSKIDQKANEINLGVDQKLTNYSTTQETTAAINLAVGQISSTVSTTYETKSDATAKLNTAKGYTDTNVTTLSTRITQTSDAITSEVTRATNSETSLSTRIGQTAKSISLTVNNGSTSSGITITTTKEDGTTSQETGTITMTGLVKFTDLSTSGSTTINGSNITTGIIKSSNYEAGVSGTAINLTNGVISSKNFTINSSGNVSVTGSITSSNVNLTGGTIKSNNYVSGTSGTLINLANGTIDSKNFKVSSNGSITASNATISGNITATSGTIGGCTISNGVLTVDNANINSINGSKITNSSITGSKIGSGTITGGNISSTAIINCGALTASATVTAYGVDGQWCDMAYVASVPMSGYMVNGRRGVDMDVIYQQEGQYWRKLDFRNGLLVAVHDSW